MHQQAIIGTGKVHVMSPSFQRLVLVKICWRNSLQCSCFLGNFLLRWMQSWDFSCVKVKCKCSNMNMVLWVRQSDCCLVYCLWFLLIIHVFSLAPLYTECCILKLFNTGYGWLALSTSLYLISFCSHLTCLSGIRYLKMRFNCCPACPWLPN